MTAAEHVADLAAFVQASPSSYHAAAEGARTVPPRVRNSTHSPSTSSTGSGAASARVTVAVAPAAVAPAAYVFIGAELPA